MRKIVAATFVSLDGVMQAPGGPQEDPTGGFAFGGWTAPHFDPALGQSMDHIFGKPFDLLLGRKTYDIFAAYWPYNTTGPDGGIGKLFNAATKYVASRNRTDFDWENSQWLGGDVVAALREIRNGDGPDLLIQGSGDLIQTLLANALIDEFIVMIFPLTLGKGKRLFGGGTVPGNLKLVSSQAFPTGVIVAKYVPDGAVRTGDFGHDEPSEAELERRRNLN